MVYAVNRHLVWGKRLPTVGRSSRSDVEINLWNDGDEEDITPSIGTTSRKQKKFSLGLGSGKPNRREYAPLELDDTE